MDLNFLIEVIKNRKVNDDNKSYTSSLFRKGLQECCKKFGEESVEVIIAALEKKESNLKEEVADLMYHLLVLLEASDVASAMTQLNHVRWLTPIRKDDLGVEGLNERVFDAIKQSNNYL